MSTRNNKGGFDVTTNGPGPGSYEPSYNALSHSPPAFRIGNSQRSVFRSTIDTPGPGSYEVRTDDIPGPKLM